MRLLVFEFVSGGGMAGRPASPSLVREGRAMRDALVEDLAALRIHHIVTTADPRFPLKRIPPGVEVIPLRGAGVALDGFFRETDAAWLIAPETGGCLESLATRASRNGARLLGPSARAIRRAADKAALPGRLAAEGVRHPETRAVHSVSEAVRAARNLGFPVVIKPARGAGCAGVTRVRREADLPAALARAQRAAGEKRALAQRFVAGTPASVALLSDGRRTRVLAVSGQTLAGGAHFAYVGGETPLTHPQAARAAAMARRTCRGLPGLKGYVGVDVVLADTETFVIEVNPRLTTSYLGVRASLGENVAGLALLACAGALGAVSQPRRRVVFSAAGRIRST